MVIDSDGSKRNFSLVLPDDENKSKTRRNRRKKSKVSNLVASTEEYSMVTEAAISSFITILEEYDIENIYLQNPPEIIKNQILKYYSDVDIENTTYKSLNIDTLYEIAEEFDKNIVGQKEVKKRILGNLYSHQNIIEKPVVLMFYGPTGVGKTETAKFLSKKLRW